MKEKPSQLTTEPDILTGEDDEENQTVGAMTSDPETTTSAAQAKSDKKGGGMKTFVIAGVICVAVAGAGVFAYKSLTGSKPVVKAKSVKKAEETKVETPATPVAPENNGFPTDNVTKEGQVAADFLKRDDVAPVAQLPLIAEAANEVAPVAPVAPVAVVEPVAPVVAVVEPVAPVIPVAPVAAVVEPVVAPVIPVVAPVEPPAVVRDTSINSAFDSMATRVDQVSTRVDGLEKFKSAQEDLNNQIEKRIVRLEGFHDGSNATSGRKSDGNASGTVAPKPRAVTKKVTRQAPAAKPKIDGDVLVDKSSVKNTAPVREAAPVVSLEIHSIYDGRVWVKKPDGSLATFTEGETLPTGEKIRSIDHEKFQVVTNKRTIRKN